jgi:hypothetical protein
MAITKENLSNKLSIRSNYGMVDGKEVVKSRTYANVKQAATDQDVYDTAVAIAAIQENPLEEVIVVASNRLINA